MWQIKLIQTQRPSFRTVKTKLTTQISRSVSPVKKTNTSTWKPFNAINARERSMKKQENASCPSISIPILALPILSTWPIQRRKNKRSLIKDLLKIISPISVMKILLIPMALIVSPVRTILPSLIILMNSVWDANKISTTRPQRRLERMENA